MSASELLRKRGKRVKPARFHRAPVSKVGIAQLGWTRELRPCRVVRGKTFELQLAALDLCIRNGANRVIGMRAAPGDRVEGKLRRLRTRIEPSRRWDDAAALVVDDGDSAALDRVDAIQSQIDAKLLERQ